MRNSEPTLGNESVLFAMLNRGKKSNTTSYVTNNNTLEIFWTNIQTFYFLM